MVIILLVLGALSGLTCMSMHHSHIKSYENVKGGVLLHRWDTYEEVYSYVGVDSNSKIISGIRWCHMHLDKSRTLHAFINWWVESYLDNWIGGYVQRWTFADCYERLKKINCMLAWLHWYTQWLWWCWDC